MRGIRQTGFSYLTYPPAEHSRFTHSLGMMHVIGRFLEAMEKQPTAGQHPSASFQFWEIDKAWWRLLKHAALLHDIGHLPFSHVTEAVVEADEDTFSCGPALLKDFLFEVEDCLSPDKDIHFAECLSLAIILTPRFRRFYRGWVSPSVPPEAVLKIGAMIIGLAPEEGMPGLAGIVSGPSIDADKVDYINRDATACGIPIGVDVSRLFVRSAFLTVQPAELQRLRSSPQPPRQAETIFVVNASGLDSIEEIGQARTALYHRVYLHQTTRNAERLLGLALYEAATNWHERGQFDPKNTMDLWCQDDFGLLNKLGRGNLPRVRELSHSLLNRQLPKRACVFGRNYAGMCLPLPYVFARMDPKISKILSKQITGTALDALRKKQLNGVDQRQFEREITEEIDRVAEAVRSGGGPCPAGMPSTVTVLPMSNLEPNRSDCMFSKVDV
jgi:deoxynucleoside triphosphate triphosphohydrolase SAMHD1